MKNYYLVIVTKSDTDEFVGAMSGPADSIDQFKKRVMVAVSKRFGDGRYEGFGVGGPNFFSEEEIEKSPMPRDVLLTEEEMKSYGFPGFQS